MEKVLPSSSIFAGRLDGKRLSQVPAFLSELEGWKGLGKGFLRFPKVREPSGTLLHKSEKFGKMQELFPQKSSRKFPQFCGKVLHKPSAEKTAGFGFGALSMSRAIVAVCCHLDIIAQIRLEFSRITNCPNLFSLLSARQLL